MTQTLQETKTCPWMDPPIHVGKTILLWGQGSDSGQPKPQEANWGWRMENNGNSVGSSGNSCRVIKEVLVSGDSFPGGKPKARKGGPSINEVSQRSRTRRQTCPAS